MPDAATPDRWLRAGLVAVLVVLGVFSLDRAARGRYDFHHFYLDARYVWDHGRLNPDLTPVRPDDPHADDVRQLPFYLPVVPLLLAPITAFGRLPAAFIWSALQVAAAGYSLRVLWNWAAQDTPRDQAARGFALAILLALPALHEAARFNQLSYLVLALVLAAMQSLIRGRGRLAGVTFGVAATLKLLPGIFLVWLLLKRRFVAAAALVVTLAVAALVPPLLVFGPRRTLEYHQQWWEHNVRGDSARGLLNPDLPDHFIDHRNQSILQVVARLAWPEHPFSVPHPLASLRPETCTRIGLAITAALGVVLVVSTRKRWSVLGAERCRGEGAIYAIGMLVFSPLLRQYYLVWALPGLVLLMRAALRANGRRVLAGPMGTIIWALGMSAWIWPTARLYGAHLAMLVLMGVLVLIAYPNGAKADARGATPSGAEA